MGHSQIIKERKKATNVPVFISIYLASMIEVKASAVYAKNDKLEIYSRHQLDIPCSLNSDRFVRYFIVI